MLDQNLMMLYQTSRMAQYLSVLSVLDRLSKKKTATYFLNLLHALLPLGILR